MNTEEMLKRELTEEEKNAEFMAGVNNQIKEIQSKKWNVSPTLFRKIIVSLACLFFLFILLMGLQKGAEATIDFLNTREMENTLEEVSEEISFNEGRATELWKRKKTLPLEIEKVKAEFESLQAEEQGIEYELSELEAQNILLDSRRNEIKTLLGEKLHSAPAVEEKKKVESKVFELKITSYNPEAGQTDSTPCVAGGTGYNVCDMARNGERPLALSQELIDWSVSVQSIPEAFSKGDKVEMQTVRDTLGHGDPRCNGVFTVADAMNMRYRNRGDIFFNSRKDNISCTVTIRKI